MKTADTKFFDRFGRILATPGQPGGKRGMLLGATALVCVLLTAGCASIMKWLTGDDWTAPAIVQVRGSNVLCDTWGTWCTQSRPNRLGGIPARDGDLFYHANDHFLPYRDSDGSALVLDQQEGVATLNGNVVSIRPTDSENNKGWQWLRNARTEDLTNLRFLTVQGKPGVVDFPLLEKVARARPDIGLYVEIDNPDTTVRLVSLFEPRILIIKLDVLATRFDELAPRLEKLETLIALDNGSLDFLPRLPRLRQLDLRDWKPESSNPIPGGNPALRSLTIAKNLGDPSILRNLTELHELALLGGTIDDLTALAQFKDLRKLILPRKPRNVLDLSALDQLPDLVWLQFPEDVSQATFARTIASHPKLEIVVLGSDEVRDLSPLRSLRHLKALVINQKVVDYATLRELKHLRYLGLKESAFDKDSASKTEALERALPDTLVAIASPVCLGSGWILLLLPALALARALRSRRYRADIAAHA